MSDRTSRFKAKVLVFLAAAAASSGVIVYAVLRGRSGRVRREIAGMSFVLPEWNERRLVENPSFGTVELVKEDGTAGLIVSWERLRRGMSIPVQAQIVRIIANSLRLMTGRECAATPAGEDVSVTVGPHKGRRIELTFDAPGARYVASVTLWVCARTQRVITFGVFDLDGVELERVEKIFLGSVDCHARPVYHKERIRLSAQLPRGWQESAFTGSTKTFTSRGADGFLVLAAFASSGAKLTAEDARSKLDFFASAQFNLTLDNPEQKCTYFRTLGHPGAEASAHVLERLQPYQSRITVWLWTCDEDKADYMALFLAYGAEAVALIDPVFATLRCHAQESRPQKGWQRVNF